MDTWKADFKSTITIHHSYVISILVLVVDIFSFTFVYLNRLLFCIMYAQVESKITQWSVFLQNL